MKLLTYIVFFAIALSNVSCQYQFVPAAVYLPPFNGTHFVVANNLTNNPNVPIRNSTNNNYYNNYNNNNNSNTSYGGLFIGNIGPYDKNLFSHVYYKEARWWSGREKIIEYPSDLPSGYISHGVISAIRVRNLYHDGSSARAYLLKGGVGSEYAKIKLESNWRKGFKFLVEIYGRV